MSKQTAVQWLIEQYNSSYTLEISDIEKAKAMEKEQIVDAYNATNAGDERADEYYNETYGGGEELLDLPQMEQELDEALANETSESLTDWVESKREDDVKKMAEEYAYKTYHAFEDATWFRPLNLGYYAGYNKAKETLYTEEDMHKAYCAGSNFDMSCLKNEQYYMFKNWFEQFKK